MNKKFAALLFAIGVGASSVAMQAEASTCTRGCVIVVNACYAAGVSEDCEQNYLQCMADCG